MERVEKFMIHPEVRAGMYHAMLKPELHNQQYAWEVSSSSDQREQTLISYSKHCLGFGKLLGSSEPRLETIPECQLPTGPTVVELATSHIA